jgi:hypothetical protein
MSGQSIFRNTAGYMNTAVHFKFREQNLDLTTELLLESGVIDHPNLGQSIIKPMVFSILNLGVHHKLCIGLVEMQGDFREEASGEGYESVRSSNSDG